MDTASQPTIEAAADVSNPGKKQEHLEEDRRPGKSLERLAFSPTEFAALFGREETWGYRQIYAGNVKVVSHLGRMLIPRSEVDRILAGAHTYGGAKKQKK